jgi:hypothetical protein
MPRYNIARPLILLSIVSIFCSSSLFAASAQGTTLAVDPSSLTGLEIGNTFQINITVSNVTDLYAWEFRLFYRNILNATSFVEGPFLESHPDPAAKTMFGAAPDTTYTYNATHGLLHLYCTLTDNIGGVDGSGTLTTITFNVLGEGDSPLVLRDTKLIDSVVPFGNQIPHTIINGIVRVGIHDIAVTNTITSKTIASDTIVYVNVTVENQGKTAENFNLTTYHNSTVIDTKQVTDLQANSSRVVTFEWSTNAIPKGNYSISASADVLPGEMDSSDNTHVDGWVFKAMLGDVNGDGKVNILDISKVAKAFNAREGEALWDPNVDLDNSGIINIIDITKVAKEFGKIDP